MYDRTLPARWVTGLDENYHTHSTVLDYCRAYLASAASKGFADDGTYTGSTDRRYYQLESSNSGEDEGETHFCETWYGIPKTNLKEDSLLLCPLWCPVWNLSTWDTLSKFKQMMFTLVAHCQQSRGYWEKLSLIMHLGIRNRMLGHQGIGSWGLRRVLSWPLGYMSWISDPGRCWCLVVFLAE